MSEPLPEIESKPDSPAEHEHAPPMTGRRGFLRLLVHGLGAIFAAVLGIPALLYLVDPRNRKGGAGDYQDLVLLDDLPVGQAREFIVRRTKRDAWTLEPNMVAGRVYVIRRGKATPENVNVDAYNVTCPHLGCAINYIPSDNQAPFQCPCHNGRFDLEGKRVLDAQGGHVADRDMYQLRVQRNPENPMMVQLEFRTSTQMNQQNGNGV